MDLEFFGLASPAAPSVSQWVREDVMDAILSRISLTYHFQDPNGFGFPDPVQVLFFNQDPGYGDVTRICIGGADPSGQNVIGNIQIDPKNTNRRSCNL